MFATKGLTVALGSKLLLGAEGGGAAGEITFSGTTRETTTVLRTRRPLWLSARTVLVIRAGGASIDAPGSCNAIKAIAFSVKQNRINLSDPVKYRIFIIRRLSLDRACCYHSSMDAADGEWAGFVLVGGASSRMGRDKARLPFRGKTLVEHVAAAVAEAAGSAILIGAPERYEGMGFARLADNRLGLGPLAGIQTALDATRATWNLIVACDMPALSGGFLRSLIEAAEGSQADCLIPIGPSGRLEPLCAAYHSVCRHAIRQALDRGVRKVTDGLAGLRIATWKVAESHWFSNVNTVDEWIGHTHG